MVIQAFFVLENIRIWNQIQTDLFFNFVESQGGRKADLPFHIGISAVVDFAKFSQLVLGKIVLKPVPGQLTGNVLLKLFFRVHRSVLLLG